MEGTGPVLAEPSVVFAVLLLPFLLPQFRVWVDYCIQCVGLSAVQRAARLSE